MAWSSPRTWTNGELVTKAIMDLHVRDQFNVLKTSITDAGLILQSGVGIQDMEVESTDNDARFIINSATDEGSDSDILFQAGGSNKGRIEYNHNPTSASQIMSFIVGDATITAMSILGDGNIGFGIASPQEMLHIQSASSPTIRLQDTTNADAYTLLQMQDVNFLLSNEYAGSIVFRTNGTEYTRITSAGRWGLGTASPQTKFHCQENSSSTTPQTEYEQLGTGDAAWQLSIVGAAIAFGLDNDDGDLIKLSYASTEGTAELGTNDLMVIDNTGNIAFNTGDLAAGNIGARFHIKTKLATQNSSNGASGISFGSIPAGAIVIGISARITTTFGNSNGLTSIDFGDGTDVDRWGAAIARTAGTTIDNLSATAHPSQAPWLGSISQVTMTPNGGTFDADGTIELLVHYFDFTAPTG